MWRDADEMLMLVDLGAMIAALVLTAIAAAGVPALSISQARLRELFHAGLRCIGATAAGPLRLLASDADLHAVFRPAGDGHYLRLGRSVLITVPLLAVFALLLTSADPLFDSLLTLPRIDVEVVMPHVIVTAFFAWIVSGWLRHALIGGSGAGSARDAAEPDASSFPRAQRCRRCPGRRSNVDISVRIPGPV